MNLEIETSKDGYKILKVNINNKVKYIGSRYNQEREINKFIEALGELSVKDNYIIFGLSFAEQVKELLNKTFPESKILIIEHNRELIEYCRKDISIKNIINDKRVFICNEKSEIISFFKNYIDEKNIGNVKLCEYCNYYNLYEDELREIYNCIKEEISKKVLNRNTAIHFGNESLENFLENIKYIADSSEVNVIKDVYKEKPAIIVSAGPSLSKNIDKLAGVKNAVVFSGGRTLRPLLERGIIPSCVGVVDSSEVSYKLVHGYIDKVESPLYFTDSTPPKVLNEHKGKKIFSCQNKFVENVIGKEIPTLYGGGSIAHSLTLLAAYLGCNPIIFIGQDCAYTGEKGHAEIAENNWVKLTYDDFYKKKDDLYVEDVDGDLVRTSIQLNTYRLEMEQIISENKNIKFINATEGGAKIKGTTETTLSNIINTFDKEEIKPLSEFLYDIDRKDIFIRKLSDTLKVFEKFKLWCKLGRKEIREARLNYKLNKYNELKKNELKINDIHEKIQRNSSQIEIVNFLIVKLMYGIENCSEYIINMNDIEEVKISKQLNKFEMIFLQIEKILDNSYDKIEKILRELKSEAIGE